MKKIETIATPLSATTGAAGTVEVENALKNMQNPFKILTCFQESLERQAPNHRLQPHCSNSFVHTYHQLPYRNTP
jgi:hypothetical protein